MPRLNALLRRVGWELRRIRATGGPPELLPDARLEFSLKHLLEVVACRLGRVRFVQVGAFDGTTTDLVGQFIRRFDWRGVLVEPQPEAFARLQEIYAGNPNVRLENVAIAEENSVRTLHRIRPDRLDGLPAWAAQTATLDRQTLLGHAPHLDGLEDRLETRSVECVTMDTLLKRSGLDGLDLLVIDTEGYDAIILASIDLATIRPVAVCYEHMHLSADSQGECVRRLTAHGYKVNILQYDTIALRD